MATPASLLKLIEDGVIDQVLYPLKSGKEADLFVVTKDDAAYAAKVYKRREQRSFRNNAVYRDGRSVRNTRSARAMAKGTRFGKQIAEEAWQKAEADALRTLHAAGVRVPQVFAQYENVLVMELITDELGRPAPQLAQVHGLTAAAAEALYDQLVGQVVLMLLNDVVHGDFSPYNVLVTPQGPVVIDLPQVVSASRNLKACVLVERDLQSVARYLGLFSPVVRRLGREAWQVWHQHEKGTLVPEFRPALPPDPPPGEPSARGHDEAAAGEVVSLVRDARRERDGARRDGRRRPPGEGRRDRPPGERRDDRAPQGRRDDGASAPSFARRDGAPPSRDGRAPRPEPQGAGGDDRPRRRRRRRGGPRAGGSQQGSAPPPAGV